MRQQAIYLLLILITFATTVSADGLAIDKVYHPYVQAQERELEWRMISANGQQKQRLGFGKSLSDNIFIEGYLVGDKTNVNHNNDNDIDIVSSELEAKWQLTEQGEYSIDWGAITELQRSKYNNWKFSSSLLMEKEWGRWVGTANLSAIYEWGDTIKDDLESSLALQTRYRYSRYFEPAVEFYSGQFTRGLGPVVMGEMKFSGRKKLHWEAGSIIGLDSKTPKNTLRLLVELEF